MELHLNFPSLKKMPHWVMCHFCFTTRHFWRKHPQVSYVDLYFISLFWPTLPSNIDAAYENFVQDNIFLFKGE